MKNWHIITFFIPFLLISCERTPVLTVKADGNYSGSFHLKPCIKGSPEPVLIDQYGNGETAACPSGNIVVLVIKGGKIIRVPNKNVKLDRTGDGILTGIIVSVP